MGLLDQMWDDVAAGPQPDRGLGRLRKITAANPLDMEGDGSKYQRSLSMPTSPSTPGTPVSPSGPSSVRKDNVWRSVFHPGSNLATKSIGSNKFDNPKPNTPTVYDWMYSGDSRSEHR